MTNLQINLQIFTWEETRAPLDEEYQITTILPMTSLKQSFFLMNIVFFLAILSHNWYFLRVYNLDKQGREGMKSGVIEIVLKITIALLPSILFIQVTRDCFVRFLPFLIVLSHFFVRECKLC